MSSRFLCKCGQRIDKNLFSGNQVQLLVAEEDVDGDLAGLSAEQLVKELILRSRTVVTCRSCSRLYVFDESGRNPTRVFEPERA
jgi:hypothetical protein